MSQTNMRDFLKKTYESMEIDQSNGKKRDYLAAATETLEEDGSKGSKKSRKSSGPSESETSPQESHQQKGSEVVDSESSEDEEEKDEWQVVKVLPKVNFPEPNLSNRVRSAKVVNLRFSMVVKYPIPTSIEKQLISTMSKLNSALQLISEASPQQGKVVLIPWEDEVVYSDRALSKFQKSKFYDSKGNFQTQIAKSFLTHYIHKWTQLPMKILKQDSGEPATKWFSVQLAFISDSYLLTPALSTPEWARVVAESASLIDGFSLEKALTQVKDPVPAVQFMNSVINPGGDWSEEGHAKAIPDLSKMLQSFLGQDTEFGLSVRKFDCGSYGNQIPKVMALTVDRSKVQKVQQELAVIFSKEMNKRAKIQNGVITNWVAVPTFSSVATSREDMRITSYVSLLAQERSFQKTIRVTKVHGIRLDNLDKVADSSYHLSAEILNQMEQELLRNGFASIRRVIYDKVIKETKQKLVMEKILKDCPDIEQDQALLEKQITETAKEISFQMVVEEMENAGVVSPYGSNPVPRPSKLSLRQMLLSLKARSFAGEKVLVFDSVVASQDGSLLLSFNLAVAEEAQTIAELLPSFIQHEMHIDPNFYCHSSLIQGTLGGVYNPLSRKGYQSRFKNAVVNEASPSKRNVLPEFCRDFSVKDLVQVLKCPAFSKAFPAKDDEDLASLAESILTSPPFDLSKQMSQTLDLESTVVHTKNIDDDLSALSGASFDSKTSRNAHHIEERAALKMKKDSMLMLATQIRNNQMGSERVLMSLGNFSIKEFKGSFAKEGEVLENYLSFSDSDSDSEIMNGVNSSDDEVMQESGQRNGKVMYKVSSEIWEDQSRYDMEIEGESGDEELDAEDEESEEEGSSDDEDSHEKGKGRQASSDSESFNRGLIGDRVYLKRDKLKKLFIKFEIDAVAITELGQNIKRIDQNESLKELTRGWADNLATRTAFNTHFDSGVKRQYGGTGLIIANQLTTRISSTDNDPSGLGRWSSSLIRGKDGFQTRIISAYRPCPGTSPASVNIQHILHFADNTVDPRKKFMEDLTEQICNWQNQGEKIILMGDMNTGDLISERKMDNFWAPFIEKTGLVDAHKSHLKQNWLPNTQNRGKVQIDFIFISPSLKIKRAGFLPFEKIPSDHRALWIDVETSSILGSKPPPLPAFQARRLKLVDPRTVHRYQEDLLNSTVKDGSKEKIEYLQSLSTNEWTREHTKMYQTLAKTYRKKMGISEKRCRRIFTGKQPWSPQFDKARKTLFLWDLIVKQMQGLSVPIRKILSLRTQLNILDTKCSLRQAQNRLCIAKNEYKKIKRRSKSLRESYLESVASALAQENNTKKSSQMRALINRERLRETYRKIKASRNKNQFKQFSSVTVRNTSTGERVTYTEKTQVEQQIIQANKSKFSQTQGQCPLMNGTFRRSLGTMAETPQSQEVLDGTFQPPEHSRNSVKDYLEACKIPQDFSSSSTNLMSLDQYRSKWSKAKERTSAGEAHFGMWKAGAKHEILGKLEWILSTLPFRHGFSPDVWKSATDVMILKASGNTDLDALRTVVLYEADFNFMNKYIGREAVSNAIRNNQMAVEQFAKPRSSPIDQCVARRVMFNISRFQKSSMVVCSSDLLSCYDRIVHSAASLAMQRFGIPQSWMKSMFSTIQLCRHKVRTGLGTSELTYGGITEGEDPLMGVGQGNGAGPAIWSIISCVLFQIMHEKKLFSTFQSKFSEDLVELVGFMYVDDNDLICKGNQETSDELVKKAQKILTSWAKLIKVTGAAIRIDKSNWYGYTHEWNPETGEYVLTDMSQVSLRTKDQHGQVSTLPQLMSDSPQKILGHYMSPSGDNVHQVEKLIEISKEEATMISQSKLSFHEARLALTHTILPKLMYPLTATTISKSDSTRIMRPVLDACLPKMGMVKSLGYDFIHGSKDLQGLGIPDLYHYSFGQQIEFIIDHIWSETETGKLIQMEIQELWVELGTRSVFDITASPRISEGIITQNSMIFAIRNYLIENKISLHIPTLLDTYPLAREGDQLIMDVLATLPKSSLSTREFRAFNYCRMYKRVRTLSDLMQLDGISFSSRAWTRDQFSRGGEEQFNSLHIPLPKQWEAWKKGLRALQRNNQFQLGAWSFPRQKLLHWDFFLDHEHQRLLLWQDKQWLQFSLLNRRWAGNLRFSSAPSFPLHSPNTYFLSRTTVQIKENSIEVEGNQLRIPVLETEISMNLYQKVSSIPPIQNDQQIVNWIKRYKQQIPDAAWALNHMEFKGDLNRLIDDFKKGLARGVGDGSYKSLRGANASILSSFDGEHYILASGPTPGSSSVQSPYRSELGAITGCLLLHLLLSKALDVTPMITISCDNDSALYSVYTPISSIQSSCPHSDLISTNSEIIRLAQVQPRVERVQGHVIDFKRWDQLTVVEKLNVKVDEESKRHRALLSSEFHRPVLSTPGIGFISVEGIPVTHSPSHSIQRQQANTRIGAARSRLNEHISPHLHRIDNESLSKASNRASFTVQLFLTKLVSRQLPVGKVLVQRKHRLSDKCPQCIEEVETIHHLFSCNSQSSLATFEEELKKLETGLDKIDTDPRLSSYLIETLHRWRRHGNASPTVYPSSIMYHHLFKAFANQERIGWVRLFQGWISSDWATAQQIYFDKSPSGNSTGRSWAVKFILLIWEMTHSIWIARNKCLHESDHILEELSGGSQLQKAITQEFNMGIQNLHKSFQKYFSKYPSPESILERPLRERMIWFKTIRTARESMQSAVEDDFSHNGPLRRWIGLKRVEE